MLEAELLQKQNLALATELVRDECRRRGMEFFINHVFAACFGRKFVKGEYLNKVARHLDENHFTMDVTGRDHFKSTRLYMDIMYAMFIDDGNGFEAHYFSYNKTLASYHMAKLKDYIANNPYFSLMIDNSSAKSVLDYNWPGGRHMTVTPQGLLSGKRGIHADRIYVDDPFKNEEEGAENDPVQIRKINDIILSELLQMVNKGGYCRVVGTPQTPADFFFNDKLQEMFNTWITPSILDENKKIALWPEWWSYERLAARRELIGEGKFNREFMAMPVTSSNSYIDKDELTPLCIRENWAWEEHPILKEHYVVAGFDIGKKRHPSHLAIFIRHGNGEDERGNPKYRYEQIFSKWYDKWDYSKQVEDLNLACEYFNISRLRYDNTRSEFEGFAERNELHECMIPEVLTRKKNFAMAANFGRHVEAKTVLMVDDKRQYNQILLVNGELDAVETSEGHGDSFFSTILALYEGEQKIVRVRSLVDDEDQEDGWDEDSMSWKNDSWGQAAPLN